MKKLFLVLILWCAAKASFASYYQVIEATIDSPLVNESVGSTLSFIIPEDNKLKFNKICFIFHASQADLISKGDFLMMRINSDRRVGFMNQDEDKAERKVCMTNTGHYNIKQFNDIFAGRAGDYTFTLMMQSGSILIDRVSIRLSPLL